MRRRNLKQAVTRPTVRVGVVDFTCICKEKITAYKLIHTVLAVGCHLPFQHIDKFQMLMPVCQKHFFLSCIARKIKLRAHILKNNLVFQIFLSVQIKITPFF